jgi:hypothetical protein
LLEREKEKDCSDVERTRRRGEKKENHQSTR